MKMERLLLYFDTLYIPKGVRNREIFNLCKQLNIIYEKTDKLRVYNFYSSTDTALRRITFQFQLKPLKIINYAKVKNTSRKDTSIYQPKKSKYIH